MFNSTDIDECANSTDNCTHGCVNTEGSYYCNCPAGYEISGDNTTCIGKIFNIQDSVLIT